MNTQIKMRNSTMSLLVASVITVFTTQVNAEWQPVVPNNNFMNWQGAPLPFNETQSNGVPWNNPSVMPITWGDCIPVPVEPLPMGVAPMHVTPMPMPSAVPFNTPAPMMHSQQAFPAPAPLYGAIPEPLPIPPIPACADNIRDIKQVKMELDTSNKKIAELKQVINDTKNQLQDSLALVEQHNQAQSIDRNNIQALKEKITQLNKTSNDMMLLKEKEGTSLQEQLTNETNKNTDLEGKLSALLKQSSMELGTLKQANQEHNSKYDALKKQLVDFKVANQTLQAQLASKRTEAASQGKQMLALKQSSTQLTSLKLAFQDKDKEIAALNKQMAEAKTAYQTLQADLATQKMNAANQGKEVLALKQASTQLTSLKSAYQDKDKELAALKRQLADAKTANQTLQANLAAQKTNAATQEKEVLALKQASTQLTSLKSAYQDKDKELAALKRQLADAKTANQTLQANLAAQKTNAANQGKEMLALKQASTQLTSLKISHQGKEKENETLKKQIAEAATNNSTLQAQIASLKTDAAAKNKQVLGLKQASSQLPLLQQAYKGERSKASGLQEQLDSCKKNNESLSAEITDLKNKYGSQAQKITSLMTTTQDLTAKKEALNAKLSNATADSDQDGILDSVDKCPTTPTGQEVDALGCFADTDKDGVANSVDQCPASPANSQVNEKGCPGIKDSDKDGVADAIDLCHSSIEGVKVNEFGCAETRNITLEGVNFQLGSAKLNPSSFPILDAAAETIKKNPNLKIEISGHTDNQGEATTNQRLSQVRANSVMIYLIRKGVAAQSLTAKGYGEEQPIASNDTKEGLATNRRVELKISK